MFNMGGTEIMVIAGIALLLLGPSQLPKLFRGIGQSIKEIRSATKEVTGGDDDGPQKLPEKDRAGRDRDAGSPGGTRPSS